MEGKIVQVTEIRQEMAPQEPKKEKGPVSHFLAVVREIIAASFWIYVLTKLFIFDIDISLAEKFSPNYVWLLNFKFFILIGTLAAIWWVTKSKYILLWSLYIFFYPAIVLLWKIPFYVFKQKSWILAFALINAAISFFTSLKYNFITAAFFLVSLAIIIGFSNEKLLWLSILSQLVILLIIYVHRFILVFKPSSIFQVHIKFFSGVRKHGSPAFALDTTIKNLPITSLDQKQLEKWTSNLQTSVLFNRICLFTAKKLRDYQNSDLNVVSYVLTILLLIVLTILSFAAINFGLYKINNDLFALSTKPTSFAFFYYCFNNLLHNSIHEIAPVMPVSQTALMIESFFGFFLVVIFVSLLLTIRSKRHAEELNKAIADIEEQGAGMESFIRDEYMMNSVEEALAELEKLKAEMVTFLYKITESIK